VSPFRRPKVTSHTVAERAGVSRTTVSFVLNGRDQGIPDETRERVLRAAAELGYVPSAAATTLASGRTRTVAFVVCDARHLLTDAFLPQAIFTLTEVAHRRGFRVLVEAIDDPRRPHAYRDLVRAARIDGMVVMNPRSDDAPLVELIDSGYPVVTIGRPPGGQGHALDVDNVASERMATEHLLAGGRLRLAHLGYGAAGYTTVAERLAGFRAGLEAAGLACDPELVAFGNYSANSGAEATRGLLDRLGHRRGTRPPFDGLVCGNDTVALGALTALRERGLRVPDDVAVVGFDDVPIAAHACPPLTTVRSPLLAMGAAAGHLVLDLIAEGPRPAVVRTHPTTLVVRSSCGCPVDPAPS
jgi:DNA-binding LacI/PurR family transcriptional regulator